MYSFLKHLFLCFSDAIVSQVLDELGLNLSDELSSKKTQQHLKNDYTHLAWYFTFLYNYHLCVRFRSPSHWRKLVGDGRKEGGASCHG